MGYLLDTNIFLWWLNDDRKLKNSVRAIIEDKNNQIYLSVISGLEISIKNRAGKLPLKATIEECFQKSPFLLLNINLDYIFQFDKLPLHQGHKDPFDRILIAQAKAENLALITSDRKIWKYKLSLVKA